MYEQTITGLLIVGLLASLIYITTWGAGAVRAYWFRTTTLTPWEITDFALFPLAATIILITNALNLIEHGVVVPADAGLMFQRILTLGFIVVIVLVRLIRWAHRWFNTPKGERSAGAALTDRPRREAS